MNPLLRWLTSPEWTHVVGALLHSLWQGAIIAIALAVLMRRFANPVTRYRCALGLLGVLVIGGVITWAVLTASKPAAPATPPISATEPEFTPTEPPARDFNSPAKVVVIGKMAPPAAPPNWTAWLALTWLVGTMAMLLRAGVKVAGADNLRRSCQPLKDEHVLTLVVEACRAVALARKIRVAVTDKLTSPAVVGVIVPTLILPLSLFSALTPEQIRFVLLHELAHIRRGDYLANLFQLFAEALLFFNPAVWWISHHIRREREACCDALAIELSGAPADYAKTLVRVAENILQPAPAAAPAFGDDGRHPSSLADRVQRLLVPGYRPALRLTWRAMLTALFVGSGLLFLSALGTRVTVAAILSPRERIERIEKKMIEYGADLHPDSAADNPNAPQIEISGRVTTADNSPLPKVKWVNIYYSRKNYSGAASARLQTNGLFSTKIQAGGSVAAVLNEPNFAPVVAGPVLLKGTNAVTNLNLVLDRGFDVPIFVTDAETGSPVVGALVKAQFGVRNMGFGFGSGQELQTDSTSVSTLAKCSASVELTLTVNAPGYEISDHRGLRLNANEPIRIQLQRGQTLSGVVLDKTIASPLTGATVRMIYEKGQSGYRFQWTDSARVLATTDANGRFTVNQLRRGTKYWLGISATGHESALLGPIMAGGNDLTVRLGPELIVRGRVLGDLEGLQVVNQDHCLSRHYSEVFDNHSQGYQEWLPVRMVDGIAMVQFTNPIPGLVRLTGGQGFDEEREVTGPVADWVIDLRKTKQAAAEKIATREVVFRFTHPAGVSPRGTVAVTVPESLDPKHRTARSEKIGITNSEVRVAIAVGGRTAIEPERMVGYWFDRVGKNGGLLSIEVTNGPGPLVIELPLISAGAIYARARNADGSPAGGLHFGVREIQRAPSRSDNSSLGSNSDSVSGNEPRAWVSGPLPLGGTYQVYGWRGNSFCVSPPITLTEARPDAEVELQFASGKTFTGLVLNPDGQPLRNLELEANFSLQNGHGFGLKPVVTDDRGEFKLENTTPELGTYSVTIFAPGLRAANEKLEFNGRTQTIRLQRGRTLSGRVVEAGTGYVIPNAEVRVYDSETFKLPGQTARTDADGRFEFTTLGDVTYSFHVGDAQLPRNISARADGSTNLTLEVKLYEWSKLKPKSPETTRTPVSGERANDRLEIQTFQIPRIAMVELSGVFSTNPPHAKTDSSIQDNAHLDTKLDIAQALGNLVYLCNLNPENYRGDSLSYDEQAGALRVRATRRDLDVIEQVIRVLNLNPLQMPPISNRVSGTDYELTFPKPTTPTIPTLTEFVGYDLATAATFVPTPVTRTGQSIDSALPLPIFRVRQVTTSHNVGDGQANVLGGLHSDNVAKIKDKVPFLGDLPLIGKLFTSESSRSNPVPTIRVNDSFDLDDRAVAENEQLNKQWFWYRGGNTITWPTTATTNPATAEPLHTRSFSVDLGQFYTAVRKSAGLSEPVTQTNLFPAIYSFFTNAGVDLDPASGRSLFVSTSRGDMTIRATLPELDAIETLLRPMPGTPLIRRTYHFDSNTVAKVTAVLSPETRAIVATNPAAGFRALLESFDRNDPRPKQVRHLGEREEIHARATAADFEQFDSALKGTMRVKPGPVPRPQSTASAETNLFTRTFVVGPMELSKALGRTGPMGVTDTAELVAACLAKAGVDLQPPKSVFFKDPLGLLLVRATPAELDALEKFIARANREPDATNPGPLNPARASNAMTPTSSSTNLQSRTYQVDANALVQALERRLGTNVFSGTKPDETKLLPALRQFFATVGVDLDGPKAVYFNGRKGELFVRATLADLEAIETLLAVLNYPSPQVNLQVRWIEVKLPSEVGTLSQGVLSEEQTVDVLHRLKQKDGFTLLSEGQITTLSTRQAQFQVAEVKTIVTGIRPAALTTPGIVATNATTASALDAQTMSFGPVLDVIPCVGADQNQIALHIEAATREFLGYDKKAPQVPIYINGKKRKTTLPLPKYLVRQLTNDCVLRDGQTLVLGNLPAQEIAPQPSGEIKETTVTASKANPLYVFVTATLIDPAGNRLNPPKQTPPRSR